MNAQNYYDYHRNIEKAEDLIFIKNNKYIGLDLLITTISSYEFAFLTDCVTAIQLSLYLEDSKSFLKSAQIAFKNGLLPRNLKSIRYIAEHPLYKQNKDSLIKLFHQYRSLYLKRIDTQELCKVIELYAYDQRIKNGYKGEPLDKYKRRYKIEIEYTMKEMMKIICSKGLPTEKSMGVDQNDIMNELHVKHRDLQEYYSEFKQENHEQINKDQFFLDERNFSSTLLFPILHHYMSSSLKFSVFTDSFYLAQIREGKLHPKDFAYLNDIYWNVSGNKSIELQKGQKFFGGGWMSTEKLLITDDQINSLRLQFYLPPIQNDRAKYKFMLEHGMWVYLGYMGTRI
ncbi:MAG: hypothetical protein JST52_11115 [Bacteroidetes bacterium]|nr:hypothetical protein [Bacteroidota bacterium]